MFLSCLLDGSRVSKWFVLPCGLMILRPLLCFFVFQPATGPIPRKSPKAFHLHPRWRKAAEKCPVSSAACDRSRLRESARSSLEGRLFNSSFSTETWSSTCHFLGHFFWICWSFGSLQERFSTKSAFWVLQTWRHTW